jgi:hypothetical protein
MDFYGPAIWGKSPGPYFYEADGNVRIHEPVFMSANFRLPISDYAGGGLLSFVWNVGIPLFAYDDFQVIRTAVRRGAGLLPAPASSRKVVVDFAYSEIHRLCEQTGAKMLILKLPGGFRDDTSYRDQLPDLHCPVVDSSPRLLARLPEASNTAWEKEYCFWRGEPLQIVDKHPNALAHAVIADVVAEVIGETEGRYVTRGGRP